jgi:hypothetical protein
VCAARTTGDQGEQSVVTGALTDAAATPADPETPALPAKTDLVVWLQLHPVQRQAYQVCSDPPHKDVFCCFVLAAFCSLIFLSSRASSAGLVGYRPCVVQGFLGSSEVAAVFNQTSSALSAISVLKKICDHPALLNHRNALKAVRMPAKVGRHVKGAAHATSQKSSQKKKTVVLNDSDSEDDFAQLAQPTSSSAHKRAAQQSESSESDEEDDLSSLEDFVVQDSDVDSESESESSEEEQEEEEAEEEGLEEGQQWQQTDEGGSCSAAQGGNGGWSSQQSQSLTARLKRIKDMHVEDSCKTVRVFLECLV